MSDVPAFLDPELARRFVDNGNFIAAELEDQNTRFQTLQTDFADDEQVRQVAHEGIAEEQTSTIRDALEFNATASPVYEQLGRISCLVHDQNLEKDDLTTKIAAASEETAQIALDLEGALDERKKEVEHQAAETLKKIEKLSPRSVERIKGILEARAEAEILTANPTISQLYSRREQISQQLEEMREQLELIEFDIDEKTNLLSLGVDSWPIPLAISIREAAARAGIVIDELPVEPELNRRAHEKYLNIRERHIDQPEAALYAALYLSEHPGQTVSVEELIHFLYPRQVIESNREQTMRTRVTSILGPECGNLVKKILDEEDFVLQYGWRRTLAPNENGRIISSTPRRIYRAVQKSELHTVLTTSRRQQFENYTDEFELSPELRQLAIQDRDMRSIVHRVLESEDFQHGQPIEPEAYTTVGETGPLGSPDLPVLDEEVAAAQGEEQAPPAPPATTRGRERRGAVAWETDFKRIIGEAITDLKSQGLLENPEGERWGSIRGRVNRRTAMTQTMLERLAEDGLIPKTFTHGRRGNLNELTIEPKILLLCFIHNKNKQYLGKGSRYQRRSIQLIEQALESYFSHKDA